MLKTQQGHSRSWHGRNSVADSIAQAVAWPEERSLNLSLIYAAMSRCSRASSPECADKLSQRRDAIAWSHDSFLLVHRKLAHLVLPIPLGNGTSFSLMSRIRHHLGREDAALGMGHVPTQIVQDAPGGGCIAGVPGQLEGGQVGLRQLRVVHVPHFEHLLKVRHVPELAERSHQCPLPKSSGSHSSISSMPWRRSTCLCDAAASNDASLTD